MPDEFDFSTVADDSGNFVDNWKDNLPSDVKEAIGDSKYFDNQKNIFGVIKSAAGLSKKMGEKPQIPGKDATDEEYSTFVNTHLGVPGEGQDYTFEFKDLNDAQRKIAENEETMGALKSILKGAGTPSRIAAKVAQNWMNYIVEDQGKQQEALQNLVDAQKEEWGNDYKGNVELAEKGMTDFLSKEQSEALESLGIKDHPVMLSIFKEIKDRITPGRILPGDPSTTGKEGETLAEALGIEFD